MKRARDDTQDDGPGSGSRPRHQADDGDQQKSDSEADDWDSFIPAEPLGDDTDPALRREIRCKYRDLITSVQQNREEMLSPSNNKIEEVLQEAEELFKNVHQAREAAMDIQLIVLTGDLAKEKVSQLLSSKNNFDPNTYAEHLLSFMGLNRLEEEDEDDEEEGAGAGYLPPDAWHRLSRKVECCFKAAPTFHYMAGSFKAEPATPKQRVERQKRVSSKDVQKIMPTQLKKMEDSDQEATEREVERILGYLKGYHQEDPTTPISFYEFVIDPNSFSRTVENIFHTSFLIRDGLAQIQLGKDKLPCIMPVEEEEGEERGQSTQCIVSLSPKLWKELIEVFDISESMIPAPTKQKE